MVYFQEYGRDVVGMFQGWKRGTMNECKKTETKSG